jgi:signal peptidase II
LSAAARLAAALLTLALLLVVDGASKSWAGSALRARGPRTVAAGHIRLRYHENPGFAFGLMRGERRPAGLVAYSAVISAGLLGLLLERLLRPRRKGLLLTSGLIALLAGTLGNLRDRLERGYVVDFIDCGAWPLFNVADACLALGVALCLVGLGRAALGLPARVAV